MQLSGPDGKPLGQHRPQARTMPTRQEKFNMIYMMVTLMTAEERRMLKKSLRPLIRELDVRYPTGMSEGDMKNELEKTADAIVPKLDEHAEPPDAEVPAQQCVDVQCEGNESAEEGVPGSEGQR